MPHSTVTGQFFETQYKMGACTSKCKIDAPWKPFVTTSVRNVVVNTLVVEPKLYMVKECGCKKCARVNKREPTHEEAHRYSNMVDEIKRMQTDEGAVANKRKSVALRNVPFT